MAGGRGGGGRREAQADMEETDGEGPLGVKE